MSDTNLAFDPNSTETKIAVERQVSDWGGGPGFYAVTDDCGPCIIAAFSFQDHAEEFVTGEAMYVCDENGVPVQE